MYTYSNLFIKTNCIPHSTLNKDLICLHCLNFKAEKDLKNIVQLYNLILKCNKFIIFNKYLSLSFQTIILIYVDICNCGVLCYCIMYGPFKLRSMLVLNSLHTTNPD